jgi:hypothetical protein
MIYVLSQPLHYHSLLAPACVAAKGSRRCCLFSAEPRHGSGACAPARVALLTARIIPRFLHVLTDARSPRLLSWQAEIPSVCAVLLLDTDGKRILAQYYKSNFTSAAEEMAFEKKLSDKTMRTNAKTEGAHAHARLRGKRRLSPPLHTFLHSHSRTRIGDTTRG